MKKKISKRLTKKLDKEEMKDILHKEKIDAIWEGIENSKRIEEEEERRAYWKKACAPYNEKNVLMSDIVKKNRKDYEENNHIFKELDVIEATGLYWLSLMGFFYFLIGFWFFFELITAGYEESCLSC